MDNAKKIKTMKNTSINTSQNQKDVANAEAFRDILEKSLSDDSASFDSLSDETKRKIAKAEAMLDVLAEKHLSLLSMKSEGKTGKAWLIKEIDSLKKKDETSGKEIELSDEEKSIVAEATGKVLEKEILKTIETSEGE